MQITNLESLKSVKRTEIVKFPNFEDGTELVAELKKPSIVSMVINDKIPNSLLSVVSGMIKEEQKENKENEEQKEEKLSKEQLASYFSYMQLLCEECFVSPTYAQIKECTGGLTDTQIFFLFKYIQKDVKKLSSFRPE